ncbi:YqhR family membrane protein [Anoxybacillus sp. J5B_2022]|uniref:YqhR family membrane protein n=1 Tax=Anoxybacillus sp. J5B_2022 TaxID=3003246 RepID=UPI002286AFC4|nr:YqhR family membrane protein [Anoxybacillus sp. J5B_2022]MCZ0754659.1 YqhR family membrane protein [Anoxybacillus sp. J5B_2022]
MKDNQQLEQNQREQPMALWMKAAITGFVGGVFWSLLGYLAHFFHFTELSPNMILLPWKIGDWKYGKTGNYLAIFLIGVLSIVVALLYYVLLRKMKSMWVGIGYGLALWILVFYVFNPMLPGLRPVSQLERNTIITTICLYILYGLFVGYSISFEAQENEQQKQPTKTANE